MICVPVIETEMAFITRCCTMLCLLVVLTTPNAATLTFHQGGYNHLQVALAPQTPVPNNCSQMLNQLEVKRKTKTNQNIKFFFSNTLYYLEIFVDGKKRISKKKKQTILWRVGEGDQICLQIDTNPESFFFFFFRKRLKYFFFFTWCLFHATWFFSNILKYFVFFLGLFSTRLYFEIKKKKFFFGGRRMRIALYTKMKRLAAGHLSKVFFVCRVGSVGRVKKLFPPVRILKFFLASPWPPPSVCPSPWTTRRRGLFLRGTHETYKERRMPQYISKSMEYMYPPLYKTTTSFHLFFFFSLFFLIRFSACDARQLEKTGRSGNTPTSRLSHFEYFFCFYFWFRFLMYNLDY